MNGRGGGGYFGQLRQNKSARTRPFFDCPSRPSAAYAEGKRDSVSLARFALRSRRSVVIISSALTAKARKRLSSFRPCSWVLGWGPCFPPPPHSRSVIVYESGLREQEGLALVYRNKLYLLRVPKSNLTLGKVADNQPRLF